MKSAELKQDVERGSTFTLTSDLSCIASILLANVTFTHVKITRHWKSRSWKTAKVKGNKQLKALQNHSYE